MILHNFTQTQKYFTLALLVLLVTNIMSAIMMVLTSLHISAYNSLPTDYLKNINVWLIFNLVFTFGWNLSTETKMSAAQLVGMFVNPEIDLLFVIAYWAQGLLFLRV